MQKNGKNSFSKTLKTIVVSFWGAMILSVALVGIYGDAWAQPLKPSDTDYVDNITKVQDTVKQKWADQKPEWQNYSGQSAEKNKENKTTTSAQPKGSPTSGLVNYGDAGVMLTGKYYNGGCSDGNIFQQLACRAGAVGSGLRSVGYIIAGFGLLVFSFAAIFGKVKWNVFATIMFSVFLLSMTFYVINTFTSKGNPNWIAFEQIKGTGMGNSTAVSATDDGKTNVPNAEGERPQ